MPESVGSRVHRSAVSELGRRLAGAQQALIEAVAALDDSGEWAADGAITCAHWIADHLDVESCTAREWLRIGRCLRALPLTAAAFADRRLSYSKIRALTRVATPENEAALIDIANAVPAARCCAALAAYKASRHTITDELRCRCPACHHRRHRIQQQA